MQPGAESCVEVSIRMGRTGAPPSVAYRLRRKKMTRVALLTATAAAGLAAATIASPAAAQYPYGNYGYGQPGYQSQQVAVDQCARAVEARLNNYAMNDNYNRWNPYNNPYRGWARQGQARVLGIEEVRLRKSDRIRVRGVAT